MGTLARTSRGWRAVIACAALYALVLQALLAAAAPHPMLPADGVVCAHDGAAPDQPGPGQAGHETCCTLACPVHHALAAEPISVPVRPVPARLAEGWSRIVHSFARPPPTHHASPRGPPLA